MARPPPLKPPSVFNPLEFELIRTQSQTSDTAGMNLGATALNRIPRLSVRHCLDRPLFVHPLSFSIDIAMGAFHPGVVA
jgi:hypothetical protein